MAVEACRTLYLHAGPHKTGSSAIQSYLDDHRSYFREHGICVFDDLERHVMPRLRHRRPTNCLAVAHLLLRPELVTPPRFRGSVVDQDQATVEAAIDRVCQALHSVRERDVVMSSEFFGMLRTPAERKSLMRMSRGFCLRPIVFIRERSALQASLRTQIEFGMRRIASDPAAKADTIDTLVALPDYPAMRSFFGPAGQFVSYDDAIEEERSAIPAFLRSLGLDPGRAPDWAGYWLNDSDAKRRSFGLTSERKGSRE